MREDIVNLLKEENQLLRKKDRLLEEKVKDQAKNIEVLKKRNAWLSCLEQAGVDNWSGYSHALDLMKKQYPEDYN